MSLMYNNVNDVVIERANLDYLPEPKSMGRFHKPYPFAEYVEDIHDSLSNHDIQVTDEQYVIQKDGQRLFGMMVVGSGDGYQLTLGVRGSHDQSIPRGIAIGTNVLVCSNLCFSGELFTGKAKQTIHNEDRIKSMIDEGVQRIHPASRLQRAVFDSYKATELLPSQANDILVTTFRQKGLSGSQLGKAIEEYDKPSYTEHDHYGNAWKLFNAMTQAIKPTGQGVDMNNIVRRSMIVSRVMDNVVGDMV